MKNQITNSENQNPIQQALLFAFYRSKRQTVHFKIKSKKERNKKKPWNYKSLEKLRDQLDKKAASVLVVWLPEPHHPD